MTDSNAPDSGQRASNTNRRSFLAGTGLAGLAAFSGMANGESTSTSDQQMTTSQTIDTDETFQMTSNSLVLGGRRIVGRDGYPTIKAAWDDAESGDVIHVHSSYDAKAAGESFPIELNYEEKEVMLSGGHPSGSVIDASHTTENVIEVLGRGTNDYRNNPVVQNLKIVGGSVGLRIRAAPFASFNNLIFHETGSDAVRIEGYSDPDSGRHKGSWGTIFTNCQAFTAGGDGFTMTKDATAHGTTFQSCRATANKGAGFRLRGYTCKIFGGTSQLNWDYGIEARLGKASIVQGTYIEGNSRGNDFPVEVYAYNADGLTIDTCYFNGINPRTTSHDRKHVMRAVNVHSTQKLTIRNCVGRNYDDGFVALFSTEDADVHCESHHVFDAEFFAEDPYLRKNSRVRSGGTILPTDLSSVAGHHDGDRGFHYANGKCRPAVWVNGNWHVSKTDKL